MPERGVYTADLGQHLCAPPHITLAGAQDGPQMTATSHCGVTVRTKSTHFQQSKGRVHMAPKAGRVTAPDVGCILIPGTREYVPLCGKQDFADMTKLTNLEIGRLTWIIWERPNHRGACKRPRDTVESEKT